MATLDTNHPLVKFCPCVFVINPEENKNLISGKYNFFSQMNLLENDQKSEKKKKKKKKKISENNI